MKRQTILLSFLLILASGITAQDKPQQWDLTNCINYALTNNIQIQKSKITLEQSKISTKLAKAQLFPNLSGSINQDFTNYPIQTAGGTTSSSYSGNYGISSSLLLFDGGKTEKNIREQK